MTLTFVLHSRDQSRVVEWRLGFLPDPAGESEPEFEAEGIGGHGTWQGCGCLYCGECALWYSMFVHIRRCALAAGWDLVWMERGLYIALWSTADSVYA